MARQKSDVRSAKKTFRMVQSHCPYSTTCHQLSSVVATSQSPISHPSSHHLEATFATQHSATPPQNGRHKAAAILDEISPMIGGYKQTTPNINFRTPHLHNVMAPFQRRDRQHPSSPLSLLPLLCIMASTSLSPSSLCICTSNCACVGRIVRSI